MGIDPGNPTGFALTTWFDTAVEPVPYEQRLSFWQRTKARLDERKRERAEQEARESQPIKAWAGLEYLAEDSLPSDAHWRWNQNPVVLVDGEMAVLDLAAIGVQASSPVSSARRTPTRDSVITKIVTNTLPIDDPELDVAGMIFAHRNHDTALERPMTIDEQVESPVWEELVERMWNPTCERGPRERDWLRQQHKRQQPEHQSRAQRKGKR